MIQKILLTMAGGAILLDPYLLLEVLAELFSHPLEFLMQVLCTISRCTRRVLEVPVDGCLLDY